MRRRDFVIALGTGVGASIAGYFSYNYLQTDGGSAEIPDPEVIKSRSVEPMPRLKADVVFGRRDDLVTIRRGEADEQVVCGVNETGAAILERLDGRHSVERIAASIARRVQVPAGESLEAKVSLFVAELAMCGFLAEPFYVTLYEIEDA
jgi:hypothetical protein